MKIKTTYIGKKNGITGFYCGFKPEDPEIEIIEERNILYPEGENMELQNIETEERFSCVWLKDGDSQDNYQEVEIIDNEGN